MTTRDGWRRFDAGSKSDASRSTHTSCIFVLTVPTVDGATKNGQSRSVRSVFRRATPIERATVVRRVVYLPRTVSRARSTVRPAAGWTTAHARASRARGRDDDDERRRRRRRRTTTNDDDGRRRRRRTRGTTRARGDAGEENEKIARDGARGRENARVGIGDDRGGARDARARGRRVRARARGARGRGHERGVRGSDGAGGFSGHRGVLSAKRPHGGDLWVVERRERGGHVKLGHRAGDELERRLQGCDVV